jgi:hypothetical protein
MQRILNVFFPDLLLPAPPGVEPAEWNMQDMVLCVTAMGGKVRAITR